MNKEKQVLSPHASAKAIYGYNILGSLCNAAFYMVLLMVVNRLAGPYEGGVFAIGYAVASLTWSIGSFETGPYQATDVENRFSFGHYLMLKILLCAAMLIVSAIATLLRGGSAYECTVIMLLCVYKGLDAFSGVFYSQFQRYGRLDISGKSLSIRVLLSMMAVTLVLYAGGNLVSALLAACLVEVLWIAGYEMRLMQPIYSLRPKFDAAKIKRMLRECLPLFIGSFLLIFLTNMPKYLLDAYYEVEMQATFSALFMPASVINMMSLFVFRPSMTKMAELWQNRETQGFKRMIMRFIAMIIGVDALAMGFAYVAGTQVLAFIYSVELLPYRGALVIIMLGGGFSALSTLLNYVLIMIRKQSYVLLGNVIALCVALSICTPIVKANGIEGAAWLYTISMMCIACPLLGCVLYFVRKSTCRSYIFRSEK